MRSWRSASPEATRAVGQELAAELAPNGTVLLYGDLGSGKTVLVQGLAAGLGIDPSEVQSPTFTLVRRHDGRRGRLYHLDLYRLEPVEVKALEIEEILAGPGVKAVEWAERLPFALPAALRLNLATPAPGQREIVELEPEGGGKSQA